MALIIERSGAVPLLAPILSRLKMLKSVKEGVYKFSLGGNELRAATG